MAETVTAMFDDHDLARRAVAALASVGIPPTDVDVEGARLRVHCADVRADDAVAALRRMDPVSIEVRPSHPSEELERDAEGATLRRRRAPPDQELPPDLLPVLMEFHAQQINPVRFNRFSSAYRYGYDLSTHPSFTGRAWEEMEPVAREGWRSVGEDDWEKVREAVRYGFERNLDKPTIAAV